MTYTTSSSALARAQWIEDFKAAVRRVHPAMVDLLDWRAVYNYRDSGYTPAQAAERYVDAKKISNRP